MILIMRKLYGPKHEITKQFEELAKNPNFKHRLLETLVKIHQENFSKNTWQHGKNVL
jgi:hypothetical protein